MYRYYLTQRPAGPGAQPRDGVLSVSNYPHKTMIPSIQREAWADVLYGRELTPQEVSDYELTPEPKKTK